VLSVLVIFRPPVENEVAPLIPDVAVAGIEDPLASTPAPWPWVRLENRLVTPPSPNIFSLP